jgi:hypothetical protein
MTKPSVSVKKILLFFKINVLLKKDESKSIF